MPSEETLTFTYQTRPKIEPTVNEALKSCAQVLSHVERKLFSAICGGKTAGGLKSAYQEKYGITARHFNAIRVQLEGKIASVKERRVGQISELKTKIDILQNRINGLKKKTEPCEKWHQK